MSSTGLEIAVVGLSCRLPGAPDASRYWENLRKGVESITRFSREELAAAGVPHRLIDHPQFVPAQGVLAGFDQFDADFFGVPPSEAALMDPQHRILLECAWAALEDCGHNLLSGDRQIGIYAGSYYNSYRDNLVGHVDIDDPAEAFARNIANEHDYLATRIAYKLDLFGPAVTVQTACSTSLVAVHLACQALLSGSCETALAGGVTARAQQAGYLFEPGGIFSADGHCRPFAATAQGTVPSNGVGMVALRRLEDAIADGDPIRAVIKGSAIGNDGAKRVGFTAPGVLGQSRIIRAALGMAEIDPATVSYVEAHGSATPVGDPIEVAALARAFDGVGPAHCAIGSVKGNIGHTHAAAGVVGLIKVILSLQSRLLPPSLHFDGSNPDIDFDATPFYVNTRLRPWRPEGGPLRAGVSSFGMGGTGAHVVVEEAPARRETSSGRRHHILPLSARSETAVAAAVERLANNLAETPDLPVGGLARTLQEGRRHFEHRRFVVTDSSASAAKALYEQDRRRLRVGRHNGQVPRVAFMFPGLGEQRVGMGRDLYATDPVFRAEIDRCADGLRPYLRQDLRALLYAPNDDRPGPGGAVNLLQPEPRGAHAPRSTLRSDGPQGEVEKGLVTGEPGVASDLDRTCFAQPAVFAIEYALARLWQSWGVRPDALLGYSIGEYVAACLSGVFSLDDALRLVARRGELIEGLPAGAMVAVPLTEQQVREFIGSGLSITAVNGPALCVVGGEVEHVADLERRLAEKHIATRRLRTTHAFHSHMMDPITAEFTELVGSVALNPPQVPYISTVTGDWVTAAQVRDPSFWARHLRQPVRFGRAVTRLWQEPAHMLLEVGPGQALSSLAKRAHRSAAGAVHASLPGEWDRYGEEEFMLTTAGKLWSAGVDLDWATVRGADPTKVSLPTYPFEGQRHWLEPTVEPVTPSRSSLTKKADIADWFHLPVWEPLVPDTGAPLRHTPVLSWLVFLDDQGVGDTLVRRLRDAGHHVTTVRPSADWRCESEHSYEIAPHDDEHYQRLIAESGLPDRVVHLWNVGPRGPLEQMLDRGFASLMRLNQIVANLPLDLAVVSSDAYAVLGTEDVAPEKAMSMGACLVLPVEQPETRCRTVDITLDRLDPDLLLAELLRPSGHPVTALRGRRRWYRTHRPTRLEARPAALRPGGTYLITGGFGGIGLALARHLAEAGEARLVLVSRTELPPRGQWGSMPADDPHAERVSAVRRLEELGAEVMVASADVADLKRMTEIADQAVARFGSVRGIVHAAGASAHGLAQLKDLSSAMRVLVPKVHGGLVVDALARQLTPEFTVYCSSTLAITGAVGQLDYVAANAFLDALAERNDVVGGPRTVSVNWDAWQDVGMAARSFGDVPAARIEHPLLSECLVDEADLAVYRVSPSIGSSWLADEHRVAGHSVVPATGHLELVRAAYEHHSRRGGTRVELRDVTFLSPVVVAEQQAPELRIILEDRRFSVVSRQDSDPEKWRIHVTGEIGPAAVEPQTCDVEAVLAEHPMQEVRSATPIGPISLGPRFRCLRRAHVSDTVAVAELELPAEFTSDLEQMRLHPALMDGAAGFYGVNFAREFRVPVSYGRITVMAPLVPRILSHHRFHDTDRPGKPVLTSDVTVTDEHGTVLLEVDNLVLKHVADLDRWGAAMPQGTDAALPTRQLPYRAGTHLPSSLHEHVAQGIRPDEGVEAFVRVIGSGIGPNVAVITKDLDAMLADIAHRHPSADDSGPPAQPRPRPDGLPAYEAPADEFERALATQWADLLGLDRVGAEDDVFELGAHSLLGLQFVGRIRRDLGIDLPLAALFEMTTVRRLATMLRPQYRR